MMPLAVILTTPGSLIRWAWIFFFVYWVVAAFGRKKIKRKESRLSRLSYTLPILVVFLLLSRPEARRGWLGVRFVPATSATEWAGMAVTVAGIALAIWARRELGGNWSATVTLKQGHELIRSGPYARIRHPIYTGILLALLGTAIEIGNVAGLIAMAICWASFWLKARREESFLTDEFGASFGVHRKQTGMFLPKLFR